jgi:hypothetical protein
MQTNREMIGGSQNCHLAGRRARVFPGRARNLEFRTTARRQLVDGQPCALAAIPESVALR